MGNVFEIGTGRELAADEIDERDLDQIRRGFKETRASYRENFMPKLFNLQSVANGVRKKLPPDHALLLSVIYDRATLVEALQEHLTRLRGYSEAEAGSLIDNISVLLFHVSSLKLHEDQSWDEVAREANSFVERSTARTPPVERKR